jgi:hypothetical protein
MSQPGHLQPHAGERQQRRALAHSDLVHPPGLQRRQPVDEDLQPEVVGRVLGDPVELLAPVLEVIVARDRVVMGGDVVDRLGHP